MSETPVLYAPAGTILAADAVEKLHYLIVKLEPEYEKQLVQKIAAEVVRLINYGQRPEAL